MQSKQRAPLSPPHEHLAPSVSLCSTPSPSLFCFFLFVFSFLFVCFSGLLFRHPGSKADEPSPPAVTWSPDKGPALIDQNVLCPTMDTSSWRHAISAFLCRVPRRYESPAPNQQVQVLKSQPPAALSRSLSSPAASSQPPPAARAACTPGPHYRSHAPPVLTTGKWPCGAECEAPRRSGTCSEHSR